MTEMLKYRREMNSAESDNVQYCNMSGTKVSREGPQAAQEFKEFVNPKSPARYRSD